MTPDDRRLLGRTLDLARLGTGRTCPNPLVGAMIVKDGAIVGEGHHRRAGDEHAETVALRGAGDRARGGVLYVSLEPCTSHRLLHGRTSPCVDQILAAGISRVVAASRDPNPAIDGRGLRRLAEAGVVVEEADSVLAARAARLNEIFFTWVRRRTPFVALKAGMTLDGRIALPSGESKWITGERARALARELRSRYMAVLVGIGTVLADDPELGPVRGPGAGTGAGAADDSRGRAPADPAVTIAARPARVVLDSHLRLPLGSKLVADAAVRPLIVYAAEAADEERGRALEERGVVVVRAGGPRVSLDAVLADLAAREITSVLVEGGGAVLGSFLAEGRADKLYLFAAPRLLRGQDALAAFGGAAPASLAEALDLDIAEMRDAGGDLMIEAYPRERRH